MLCTLYTCMCVYIYIYIYIVSSVFTIPAPAGAGGLGPGRGPRRPAGRQHDAAGRAAQAQDSMIY